MNAIVAVGSASLFRVVDAYRAALPSAVWVTGLKTPRDPNDPLIRSLEALLEPFMEQYFLGEAQAKTVEINARLSAAPPYGELGAPRLGDAALATLARGLAGAMALVEMLDRAHATQAVELVLTDDVSDASRTAIAWARARAIPSASVPAGATLRRPRWTGADCTFVIGERARRAYSATGAAPSCFYLPALPGGPPVLSGDECATRRAESRAAFTRALGWSATDTVVVFEPPERVRESALESADASGASLSAMFTAFAFARSAVPEIRLAVMAQPSSDGAARAAAAAATAGVAAGQYAYAQADHDVWTAGADIVVASDSPRTIDAALRGIPSVNLWQPDQWYRGAAFSAEEGLIDAAARTLGGALLALINSVDLRAQIAGMAARALSDDAAATRASAGAVIANELVRRRRSAPLTQRPSKPDIAIWSPDYQHSSGGIRALFRLCHLINIVGGDASMLEATKLHPTWNAPRRDTPITDQTIVIVPEIVFVGPSAKRIVRWVLNKPGLLAGPATYGPEEMVFYYHSAFRAAAQAATSEVLTDDRELEVFTVEPELFFNDRSVSRMYDCVYVGKGEPLYRRLQVPGTRDALVISRSWPQSRVETAALLRGCRRFYSYDSATAITLEAALCGAQAFTVGDNGQLSEVKRDYDPLDTTAAHYMFVSYYETSHIERFLRLISERWP